MELLSAQETNEIEVIMKKHNVLEMSVNFRRKWEDASGKKISEISSIYHYTSIEGLKGILDNSSLRFTNGKYLNDSTEFLHGINKIKECAENIKKKQNNIENKNEIDKLFDEKIKLLIEKVIIKSKNTFILSTSLNNDSLMLWSNYSNYSGYSIGINFEKLRKFIFGGYWGVSEESERIKYSCSNGEIKDYYTLDEETYNQNMMNGKYPLVDFCGVIYNEDIQNELILYDLRVLYEDICMKYYNKLDFKSNSGIYKDEKLSFIIDEIVEGIAASFSLIIVYFKNKGFYPEEEFRITITVFDEFNLKEILNFRTSNGIFMPYIESVFMSYEGSKIFPIDSITIGPINSDIIAKDGLLEYINHIGFDIGDRIYRSNITLRY
ncbi:DUF2971 domain-containing protein [Clostridium paridis]|uniref:DUF2971 domain-containing protein n=1 Tax=Clostridium paridis TaxID=2803863 RepID=A0A937FHS4_9CLOT|nr:DUF2971 domain-containing protein [Clostridium paridis]MBL4932257.1 DUF2971 domain-containing protein [Clostridium paridis]